MMYLINIKAAIAHYNDNVKDKDIPKMSQRGLGVLVVPENPDFYISMWTKGLHLGKLQAEEIHKICEATGVDANFLFGIKPMVIKKIKLK